MFLMIINTRFFLFWCLMLLSTFANKHEILMSAYHFLAACLAKRQFSKELLDIKDDDNFIRQTTKNTKSRLKKRYKNHKKLLRPGGKKAPKEETKMQEFSYFSRGNQILEE